MLRPPVRGIGGKDKHFGKLSFKGGAPKCLALFFCALSRLPPAGSAPDRMHRAGDASRDTLEGEDPPLCCPPVLRPIGDPAPAPRHGFPDL